MRLFLVFFNAARDEPGLWFLAFLFSRAFQPPRLWCWVQSCVFCIRRHRNEHNQVLVFPSSVPQDAFFLWEICFNKAFVFLKHLCSDVLMSLLSPFVVDSNYFLPLIRARRVSQVLCCAPQHFGWLSGWLWAGHLIPLCHPGALDKKWVGENASLGIGRLLSNAMNELLQSSWDHSKVSGLVYDRRLLFLWLHHKMSFRKHRCFRIMSKLLDRCIWSKTVVDWYRLCVEGELTFQFSESKNNTVLKATVDFPFWDVTLKNEGMAIVYLVSLSCSKHSDGIQPFWMSYKQKCCQLLLSRMIHCYFEAEFQL